MNMQSHAISIRLCQKQPRLKLSLEEDPSSSTIFLSVKGLQKGRFFFHLARGQSIPHNRVYFLRRFFLHVGCLRFDRRSMHSGLGVSGA